MKLVILEDLRLCTTMVIIYCYLERENYKDLKIRLSKISYFDINAAYFSAPPSNKRCTLKVH